MLFKVIVVTLVLFIGDGQALQGPFTEHFSLWLESAGYADYDFPALHLGINASYGGKEGENQQVSREPVIFIHGNSDGALQGSDEEYASGWSASINHFLSQGYTSAELYAVTWGDRQLSKSFYRTHSCATLMRVRRFIEAVLAYTNATKVDIIAHSMGVTLARQAIHGGMVKDSVEICMLGTPINDKIQTFVGLGGANYGLCSCDKDTSTKLPACGPTTGFFSGNSCQQKPKSAKRILYKSSVVCTEAQSVHKCNPDYAENLKMLNDDSDFKVADYVMSFWSDSDEILGNNNVWGRKTSYIPGSDNFIIYGGKRHHALKTDTVNDQYHAVNNHNGFSK